VVEVNEQEDTVRSSSSLSVEFVIERQYRSMGLIPSPRTTPHNTTKASPSASPRGVSFCGLKGQENADKIVQQDFLELDIPPPTSE
jgi:hypothetical protein